MSYAARVNRRSGRIKTLHARGVGVWVSATAKMLGLAATRLPRTARSSAFTLVELLVVISIIGVLAALLLPSLAQSKAKAQRIKCVNNLKQLGYAIEMFGGEHDQRLPGPIWQGIYDVYNDETERLPYYLTTYLGLPAPSPQPHVAEVCICPSAALKNKPPSPTEPLESLVRPISYLASAEVTNSATDVMTRPFGYPYSSKFYRLPKGPDEPPKKTTQIRNPSAAWAITDIDQENAFPGGYYYPFLSAGKVHVTLRNQLFFDWHVAAVKD